MPLSTQIKHSPVAHATGAFAFKNRVQLVAGSTLTAFSLQSIPNLWVT